MVFRILFFIAALVATPAMADRRVALIIGNAAYSHASALANPVNDAGRIAQKMQSLGYEVLLRTDLRGQEFRIALGEFTEAALGADVALVYYAGHGIELSGKNYMIPIDSEMRSEMTAQFEAIDLDQIMSAVRGAKSLGIVMVDACRDNPFAKSIQRRDATRAVSRGLAPVPLDQQSAILLSFAAEAGRTADDGESGNSPYAEAFLELLDQPGMEVGRMFRSLRAKVRDKTNGKQTPVEEARLPDFDVFLTSATAPVQNAEPTVKPNVSASVDPTTLFFDAVRANDRDLLAKFVSQFPNHERAADARRLIEAIEDDRLWAEVKADGSALAFDRYLLVFPNGRHAAEAAALKQPPPAPVTPKPKEKTYLATPRRSKPSFNCAMAGTPVEFAICASEELAVQDQGLVRVYKKALAAGRVTKTAQRDWVYSREDRCATAIDIPQCVFEVTKARVVELGG